MTGQLVGIMFEDSCCDRFMHIRDFDLQDKLGLVELWDRCGLTRSWNDPDRDIERKLESRNGWLLVGILDDRVVAAVMIGFDGHRGWVNYLAVDPDCQRAGFGRAMMQEAEQRLLAANCPKINLQIRQGNREAVAFYESIGYSADLVVSMGKRLIPDSD